MQNMPSELFWERAAIRHVHIIVEEAVEFVGVYALSFLLLRDTQKHPVIMRQAGRQLIQAPSHWDLSRIHSNDSVVWENCTSFIKEKKGKEKNRMITHE